MGERCNDRAYIVIKLLLPGKLPDYLHLKIFCCAAYSHQNIGKLNPRSQICVFWYMMKGSRGTYCGI